MVRAPEDVHAEGDVDTPVAHRAHVLHHLVEAGGVGIGHVHQHGGGGPVVELEGEVDAVEHASGKAYGQQGLLLPGQLVVGGLYYRETGKFLIASAGAYEAEGLIVADFRVTLGTVAGLEVEGVDPAL